MVLIKMLTTPVHFLLWHFNMTSWKRTIMGQCQDPSTLVISYKVGERNAAFWGSQHRIGPQKMLLLLGVFYLQSFMPRRSLHQLNTLTVSIFCCRIPSISYTIKYVLKWYCKTPKKYSQQYVLQYLLKKTIMVIAVANVLEMTPFLPGFYLKRLLCTFATQLNF